MSPHLSEPALLHAYPPICTPPPPLTSATRFPCAVDVIMHVPHCDAEYWIGEYVDGEEHGHFVLYGPAGDVQAEYDYLRGESQ